MLQWAVLSHDHALAVKYLTLAFDVNVDEVDNSVSNAFYRAVYADAHLVTDALENTGAMTDIADAKGDTQRRSFLNWMPKGGLVMLYDILHLSSSWIYIL